VFVRSGELVHVGILWDSSRSRMNFSRDKDYQMLGGILRMMPRALLHIYSFSNEMQKITSVETTSESEVDIWVNIVRYYK
jgi:hypothetical protein